MSKRKSSIKTMIFIYKFRYKKFKQMRIVNFISMKTSHKGVEMLRKTSAKKMRQKSLLEIYKCLTLILQSCAILFLVKFLILF